MIPIRITEPARKKSSPDTGNGLNTLFCALSNAITSELSPRKFKNFGNHTGSPEFIKIYALEKQA